MQANNYLLRDKESSDKANREEERDRERDPLTNSKKIASSPAIQVYRTTQKST